MKKRIQLTTLLAGIMICTIPLNNFAQDWPQWRGANRDGKVTVFVAPQIWPEKLTQSWKITVGYGDASPVLVGQKLYVFARQGSDEVLLCLDANSGKELWRNSYAAVAVTGPPASHPGPRSTPTVAEGKVVTLGVGGIISCLDALTGKPLWRNEEFTSSLPVYYTAMSPVITDGICIAHLGGTDNGEIIAFDLVSGNKKWEYSGDAPAYASPILITVDGTKQVVVQAGKNLLSLSVSDGKLLWQIPTPPEQRFYNSATPVSDGHMIIYTGQGTGTRAINIQKDGDKFITTELWHNPELGTSFNTPVLKESFLYGLTPAGKLYCMNAQNGQTAWVDISTYKNFGAVLDAGSVMLALPSTSELVVYKPDKNAYSEIARIKVADTPVYAHPILIGNRIYVKDNETLVMWTIE